MEKDYRLYNFTIYDQVGYEIHKHFLWILNKTQEIGVMGLQKLVFPRNRKCITIWDRSTTIRLSVDANDVVDKHDHPRAMYKWRNKENQKRMINPIFGASHGSIHHGISKAPSSIKLMSIQKEKLLGYIVIPIHNVYSLRRAMLQYLHWEIYMIPNNIGYKHFHGAI